jgi:hypothetical protein
MLLLHDKWTLTVLKINFASKLWVKSTFKMALKTNEALLSLASAPSIDKNQSFN